jgi:hypothetical protein
MPREKFMILYEYSVQDSVIGVIFFFTESWTAADHFALNIAVQQEMFEREIGRLRSLYQQQQQPPQPPTLGRSNSRDLDSQFANMSLKHKDNNSGRDAISGPLRT